MSRTVRAAFLAVAGLAAITIGLGFGLRWAIERGVRLAVAQPLGGPQGITPTVGEVGLRWIPPTLTLKDLTVSGNPRQEGPAFLTVGRSRARLGVARLIRGDLHVRSARIDNATLTLVRRRGGELNVPAAKRPAPHTAAPAPDPAPARSGPASSPAARAAPTRATRREAKREPDVVLQDVSAALRFDYMDHELGEPPLKLSWLLRLKADGVSNARSGNVEWGAASLAGGLAAATNEFVVDAACRVAPLADPERPSFDLTGTVSRIDTARLGSLGEKIGIASRDASIRVDVQCRDGVYEDGKATLIFTFRDPEFVGGLKRRTRGFKPPPELTLTVPLRGDLRSPEVNLPAAVLQCIVDTVARSPNALFKSW